MTRSKILSALAAAGLLAGAGAAQPPAKDPKPVPPKEIALEVVLDAEKVVLDAKPDPVADAVLNHPDVRVAEAKLRVAEAELAQAKLLVAQRVTVAQGKLQDARAQVQYAVNDFARVDQLRKAGGVPQEVHDKAVKEMTLARSAVTAAEAELRTAQGIAPGKQAAVSLTRNAVVLNDLAVALDRSVRAELVLDMVKSTITPGSPADKLRGLIDKPVKLGEQNKVKFPAAVEALKKAAGTDLEIRVPTNWTTISQQAFTLPAGEMSFAAWLDLMLDEWNAHVSQDTRLAVYVRGYGLLITNANFAPPGALPLNDVIRQFRTEKAEPKKP